MVRVKTTRELVYYKSNGAERQMIVPGGDGGGLKGAQQYLDSRHNT